MWVYVYIYKSENLRNRTARYPPQLDWVLCAIRQQPLDNTMGLLMCTNLYWGEEEEGLFKSREEDVLAGIEPHPVTPWNFRNCKIRSLLR
jgi:hypothetical protein